MDSIASFFGINKKSNSTSTSSSSSNAQDELQRKYRDAIVVSYQERYYDIHFRDFKGGIGGATVADLKDRCKKVTGVTLATMKLKVSGAYIKDDTAYLPSVGVLSGSLVLLMGDTANTEQLKQTTSGNPEEVGYMNRISKVMGNINGAKNKIEEFDIMVVSALENPAQDESKKKETEDLGIYLSELLMQSLITLDGVECPSEFETARKDRRQAVKVCQELMDRVDQTRAVLKQLYTTNNQQQKL